MRKIVVVGGVAGGMSAATRLRRLDESAEITVIERSGHVSYANCGLPYYLGSVIEQEEDLLLQTPERLNARFNLDVRVNTEVVAIDSKEHRVGIRRIGDDEVTYLPYDKLILSPGAKPVVLDINGADYVKVLRTVEDVRALVRHLGRSPKGAVVIGAGFVGLETAENLKQVGIDVTVIEAASQVLPVLDPELAVAVEEELLRNNVSVLTGVAVREVDEGGVILSDGRRIDGELVVSAVGVRPDVSLALDAGLRLGPRGGIAVDEDNLTSDPDIYAVGDAVEKFEVFGNDTSLIALANIANRQGRRVADHICGLPSRHSPSLGTAIVRVFDLVAGTTGWSEKRLRGSGISYAVARAHPMDHASYYPGAEPLSIKLLFDTDSGLILGAQAVGRKGVDKRIDVLATAIRAGMTAEDLINLELAYAPPFSSAKDPINMLGYIAENIRFGDCDVAEPEEIDDLVGMGWQILDVRSESEYLEGSIPGSRWIPIDELRTRISELPSVPYLVYCAVGLRGHTATRLLKESGFKARNMNGGYLTYLAVKAAQKNKNKIPTPQGV
ncbi:NADPH-dependent 2,4-dienoyl-CoA reductase, sulfur reductase [Ferrithrix thermotolerans DSM 19514]|uniref:NADPH-dependent 2,4-dienoyl-CoA reductase, sulfur reductase n=1 Tax=Ferrithrix thermotolerans DSM 19514 TaxID=1121881 RepID=A0A1M4XJE0_9ACTN|nr:FAD-dependent oxidoreductase [Ferrithrix thermotolerans]SHE93625.1 NADPH-dependent 2,4-dienoyl-CoA reductase, sulfur reductase [Ferrithrix thermotolerans DSM 19514]